MQATITKRWYAVPPGQVYPKTFQPGDTVSGELAELALELDVAEASKPASSSAPLRARVKKGVEGFADGVIVEGDEARQMIADGKAVLVKDKAGPSETKA